MVHCFKRCVIKIILSLSLEQALNNVKQQNLKVKAWVNYVHKRLHHRHQLEHTTTSRSSRVLGATTRRSARQEASQNSYDSSYKEPQSELCDTQRVGEGAARNGKWSHNGRSWDVREADKHSFDQYDDVDLTKFEKHKRVSFKQQVADSGDYNNKRTRKQRE
jgi:hypothetical protein